MDKMRLRQIVLNLVGNALKFTEKGEVKIRASISRRQSDTSNRLFITVRDTGIGIPEDRLGSIFDKFTQADDTTARRYGGTGLGLPISAELAELMDGELRAESEVGEGSLFILSLPLREGDEEPVSAPFSDPVSDCGPTARLRVLVAEDNPVNQELTIAMVNKAGHEAILVHNGQEAVDAVLKAKSEELPFDMVLMDMQMPKLDGLQASCAIRDAGIDGKTLPIIAVTANAYSDDIERCIDAGMQGHLAKPLRLKELCCAIGSWSARTADEPQKVDEPFEQEINPRLRKKFEDRKTAAVDAIKTVIADGSVSEDRSILIAGLLHQIAGVAAFFGQQDLGEFCRCKQHELNKTKDNAEALSLLETIRKELTTGV